MTSESRVAGGRSNGLDFSPSAQPALNWHWPRDEPRLARIMVDEARVLAWMRRLRQHDWEISPGEINFSRVARAVAI